MFSLKFLTSCFPAVPGEKWIVIFLFVVISAHDVGEFEVNLLVNKLVPVVRTVLSHLNVNNLSHF